MFFSRRRDKALLSSNRASADADEAFVSSNRASADADDTETRFVSIAMLSVERALCKLVVLLLRVSLVD